MHLKDAFTFFALEKLSWRWAKHFHFSFCFLQVHTHLFFLFFSKHGFLLIAYKWQEGEREFFLNRFKKYDWNFSSNKEVVDFVNNCAANKFFGHFHFEVGVLGKISSLKNASNENFLFIFQKTSEVKFKHQVKNFQISIQI